MTRISLFCAILLTGFLIAPAIADELFYWEDENGVIQSTNDPQKVPAKHRENTRVIVSKKPEQNQEVNTKIAETTVPKQPKKPQRWPER